jgi:hypothetical protein
MRDVLQHGTKRWSKARENVAGHSSIVLCLLDKLFGCLDNEGSVQATDGVSVQMAFCPSAPPAQSGNCWLPSDPPSNISVCNVSHTSVLGDGNDDCCRYGDHDHIYRDNCCCIANFYRAGKNTRNYRSQCFIALVTFYALALVYLLYDLYQIYGTKKQKNRSFLEVIKSRRIILIVASALAMITGILCATSSYLAFTCFGGESPCAGGPSYRAYYYLSAFIGFDPASTIFFILSKIMTLQNTLRTVQSGLNKVPDAPSGRVMLFVDSILIVAAIVWFSVAMAAVSIIRGDGTIVEQFSNDADKRADQAKNLLKGSDILGAAFMTAGITLVRFVFALPYSLRFIVLLLCFCNTPSRSSRPSPPFSTSITPPSTSVVTSSRFKSYLKLAKMMTKTQILNSPLHAVSCSPPPQTAAPQPDSSAL